MDQDKERNINFDALSHAKAALSLFEALLLALEEKQILLDYEIDEIFESTVSAHANEASAGIQPALNREVARLLQRLQTDGNSVRSKQ